MPKIYPNLLGHDKINLDIGRPEKRQNGYATKTLANFNLPKSLVNHQIKKEGKI